TTEPLDHALRASALNHHVTGRGNENTYDAHGHPIASLRKSLAEDVATADLSTLAKILAATLSCNAANPSLSRVDTATLWRYLRMLRSLPWPNGRCHLLARPSQPEVAAHRV